MDEPTKRAWSKPELIAIVRGQPEEAVLGACKNADTRGEIGASDGICTTMDGPPPICVGCIAMPGR